MFEAELWRQVAEHGRVGRAVAAAQDKGAEMLGLRLKHVLA